MPIAIKPLRRSCMMLVMLFFTACDRERYLIHEFHGAHVDAAPDVSITVDAHGTWVTESRKDSTVYVKQSPYVVEVRLKAPGGSAVLTNLTIGDSVSTDMLEVDAWDVAGETLRDSTILYVNRSGITLAPGSKRIAGVVQINRAEQPTVFYSFSTLLQYQYREELRSRFMERLRGL